MSELQFPMVSEELEAAQNELVAARKKVDQLRKEMLLLKVKDYQLKDTEGNPINLSELFGDSSDLILVHNMGKSCSYCTMWADSLTGINDHLSDRAAFVVVSHDQPEVAKEFSAGRHWNFKLYSNAGTDFFKDMGFESAKGEPWPGVSTFHRADDGSITRISYAFFGPGDDFCSVWHFLDMLKDGADGWSPKYKY